MDENEPPLPCLADGAIDKDWCSRTSPFASTRRRASCWRTTDMYNSYGVGLGGSGYPYAHHSSHHAPHHGLHGGAGGNGSAGLASGGGGGGGGGGGYHPPGTNSWSAYSSAGAPPLPSGPAITPGLAGTPASKPLVPLPDFSKEHAAAKKQLARRQILAPDFSVQWKKHATIANAHKDSVRSLAWSVDGAWLATCGDEAIKLWAPGRSTDARSARVLSGHAQKVNQVCWDPVNPFLFASSGSDRTVRLWDIRSGQSAGSSAPGSGSGMGETKPVSTLSVPTTVLNMTFHPEGQYLAVSDHDDRVSLLDPRNTLRAVGLIRDRKTSKDEEVNEIAWTPDGKQFLLAKIKGAIEVLDASSGSVIPPLPGTQDGGDRSAPAGASSTNSVTTGEEPTAAQNGPPLLQWPRTHLIQGHTSNLFALACDPTNRYAVSGGADSVLSLWNTADWTQARAYEGLRDMVRSVGFSFEGEFLACLGEQSMITILASETMEAVHALPFAGSVGTLVWHPSRYTLAYATAKTPAVVNVAGGL